MKKLLIALTFLTISLPSFAAPDFSLCNESTTMCQSHGNTELNSCQEFYNCQATEHSLLNALVMNAIQNADYEMIEKCSTARSHLEDWIWSHATTIECWTDENGNVQFGG